MADLVKEYRGSFKNNLQPIKTIYNLLSRSGQNFGTLLQLAKIKREKEALLKIIDELIADQRLEKKIQNRPKSLWLLIQTQAVNSTPPKSKKN